MRSRAAASLTSTPARAPRPVAVMIDIGVARPSAHGQAMISTEIAATSAKTNRGSGPTVSQTPKATIATATTAGTKYEATRSTSPWMGARERCAPATIATICDSTVSSPTRPASITKLPVLLIVPPVTGSPADFSTGTGSPVSRLSSTDEPPSSTVPSTGTASPGRTRSRSPSMTLSSGASYSSPPYSAGSTRRAVLGDRSSSALMASPVFSRARSSST